MHLTQTHRHTESTHICPTKLLIKQIWGYTVGGLIRLCMCLNMCMHMSPLTLYEVLIQYKKLWLWAYCNIKKRLSRICLRIFSKSYHGASRLIHTNPSGTTAGAAIGAYHTHCWKQWWWKAPKMWPLKLYFIVGFLAEWAIKLMLHPIISHQGPFWHKGVCKKAHGLQWTEAVVSLQLVQQVSQQPSKPLQHLCAVCSKESFFPN